jgi:hypothetical protein
MTASANNFTALADVSDVAASAIEQLWMRPHHFTLPFLGCFLRR